MSKYDPAPTVAAGLVRLARAKAGLTQSELARRAGVTQQTVSSYETGRKDPTLSTLQRLIAAAGFELRFSLEPLDQHDESVQRYLDSLDPDSRSTIEQRQRERVERARLKRVRGK